MDKTLQQVGELLLDAIPTMLVLVLTYVLYKVLVHKPLARVLEGRRSKTEGAIEKAKADIAAAEGRTAEYEQRLREARLAVFKRQEARRQLAMQARAATVAETRERVRVRLEGARAVIEQDKEVAKETLQVESRTLAAEIIRTVLQSAAGQVPAGGGR